MKREACGPHTPNVSIATGTNMWNWESAVYFSDNNNYIIVRKVFVSPTGLNSLKLNEYK